MLFFLHLPKTAGTTLRQMLVDVYGESAIFMAYADTRHKSIADAFLDLPERQQQSFALISGHFSFGIHALIPGEHRYITMLREPIDRVASTYFFMRGEPTHTNYSLLRRDNMSLTDFMQSGIAIEVDNGLTRMVAGPAADYPYGNCPDSVLEIAKTNLRQQFDVVGLSEQFNASIILASRILKWARPPLYVKVNVTEKRKSVMELTDDERGIIKDHCRLDVQLYEYAQVLLAEQIANAGPEYGNELASYEGALDNLKRIIDGERKRYFEKKTPFLIGLLAQNA